MKWVGFLLGITVMAAGSAAAASLFKDREIHLSNAANSVVRLGITETTSGHNFIPLMENARQESISLGKLGYWEKVPDPPAFLRNYDLQLSVRNQSTGNFQLELTYAAATKDIRYRVLEGAIKVALDQSGYYPTLIIVSTAPVVAAAPVKASAPQPGKQLMFFDFNSFDSDLRRHYGKVKHALGTPDVAAYFYYYESTGYKKYYFKTFRDTAKLDTEKMGLSLEDGTLEYYQQVLDNLKALHGPSLTGKIIIVTRFGKKYAPALKKYARDIGIGRETSVDVWSYEDVR
jgi:hypothetical protein